MKIINNRYHVIENVLTDTFGDILLVEDKTRKRICYMRLFLVEFSQSDLIKHFKSQFVHYSTMSHPNLVADYKFDIIKTIDDKKSTRTQFFYAYERSEFKEISYMDLSRQDAMDVLIEICKTLRYLHFRGYVYKYLTFDNIHIYRDEYNMLKVKLTDLASLELYKDFFKQDKVNVQFIAPEIFWKENHNVQADVYSLGIVFYYLYHRTSYKNRIVDESLRKNIKNGVDRIVSQMIRISIVDEIESVKDFQDTIQDMLNISSQRDDYAYYNRLQLKAPILERFNEARFFVEIVKNKFSRHNDTNAVIVVGDMGTGKTRIMDEAETILRWEGHRVVRVNCHQDMGSDFKVFKQIIKEIVSYGDVGQELIMKYGSELVKLLPEFENQWGIAPAHALEGDVETLRIKNRMHHFLREYSILHNLVIVLDGIQTLDEDQVTLLEYLFNDNKENQFIIIASYENDNLVSSKLSAWDKGNKILINHLTNFNYDEASNFVSSILGVGYNPIELTAKVMREAHGNLKMIKELLISLYEKKYIYVNHQDEWVLNEHFDEFEFQQNIQVLPASIQSLEGISQGSLKVLDLVSVFNEAAPLECLVSLLADEGLDIRKILGQLTQLELLKMKFDDLGETYDFCSRSLKRLIMEKLEKQVKINIHHRIAMYFEKRLKEDGYQYMDVIIHHFSNANIKEKAVLYCDQLALYMKRNHMYMQAIELYNRALGLLHTGERTSDIASHYYEIAKIYDLIGEGELSRSIVTKGLEIAIEFRDDLTDIQCRLLLSRHYILRRDNKRAQMHMDMARSLIEKHDRQDLANDLYQIELMQLVSEKNTFEAKALIDEIEDQTSGEHYARLLNSKGILTLYEGDLNESLKYFKKSLEAYDQVDHPNPLNALLPLNNIGAIYAFFLDDLEKGRTYFNEGLKLLAARNLDRCTGIFSINIGETYLIENNPERAFEYFQFVLDVSDKTMDASLRSDVCRLMCELHLQNENYQKASFYLKKLESEYEDFNHNTYVDIQFYLIHINYYVQVKDYDMASQWCKRLRNSDLNIENNDEFLLRVLEYEVEMFRKQYFNYTAHVDLRFVEVLMKTQSSIVEAKIVRSLIHRLGINLLNYKKYMDVNFLVKLDQKLAESYNTPEFERKLDILKAALCHERVELYEAFLEEHGPTLSKENLWLINKFIGDEYYETYNYYKSTLYYFNAFDILRNLTEYVPKVHKESYIFSDEVKLDLKSKINNIHKKLGGQSYNKKTVYTELEIRKADDFFDLTDFKTLIQNKSIKKSIYQVYRERHQRVFESVHDLISNFGKNELYNIQLILKYCTQLLMGDRGYIFILDEDHEIKEVIKNQDDLPMPDFDRILKSSVNISSGLLMNAIYDYKRNFPFLEEQKGLLCIPIIKKEAEELKRREHDLDDHNVEVKGYMYIEALDAFNNFTQEAFDDCMSVMNMLYFFVDNYNLKKISTYDNLTDVYLRSYFEDQFSRTLQKAKLYNDQLSVVMLDIDKFKAINDTYGHRKGDEILTGMCQVIKNNIRTTDLVGRYGGEEFILVFPGTDKATAYKLCEKIRVAIEGTNFFNEDRHVTISLGIASFPELGLVEEELIEKADQALYASKNSGRNQTTIWTTDLGVDQLRFDKLAGILEGNISTDTRNVQGIVDIMDLLKEEVDQEEMKVTILKTVLDICEAQESSLIKFKDNEIVKVCTRYSGDQAIYEDMIISEELARRYFNKSNAEHFINWNDISSLNDKLVPDWKSIIVSPLMHKGETKGLLVVSVPITSKEFGFNTTNFVNAVSGVIGAMI